MRPVKRKLASGEGEASDNEESKPTFESYLMEQVTKRSKHVDTRSAEPPPDEGMVITTDIPDPQPTQHVAVAHPPVAHAGPVHVPAVVAAQPPPQQPAAPRLIAGNGRGPGAINDDVFNTINNYNYPALDVAVSTYRNNKDKKATKRLSEKMGERGAVAYLRKYTGYGDIEMYQPDQNNPHVLPATPGQRWTHAVAFGASGVADLTYWDGAQIHVVEAKGGNSALGRRSQAYFHVDVDGKTVMVNALAAAKGQLGAEANLAKVLKSGDGSWKNFTAGEAIPYSVTQYNPTQLRQGGRPYLLDTAHAMVNSPLSDGRNLVGQAILDNFVTVHYPKVRTKSVGAGADVKTF